MNDRSRKRLLLSLLVTFLIFVGEVVGGLMSHSLSLLSDAGHVLTDAFALGLSLMALLVMRRPSDYKATYGYQRIGLLAALINGVSLVLIAIFIFIEAYKRFYAPPEINSSVMLSIATAGLAGNLVMAWILGHKHDDLNMKSAWLHVVGDTVSSVGVIIAGVIIRITGWVPADTIASGLVGCMIIIGGTRVIKEALWILLDLSPLGFHAEDLSRMIGGLPGVRGVHDVHVWSIGHGIPAFSGHVQVHDQKISEADVIREEIEHMLAHEGIRHAVIQMECADCCSNDLFCRIDPSTGAAHHH
ncbi:MAG: cation diffusion facilitator family transporter [Nitrospiraceae bacterium]|nr:cation diffusion facilitator family transporter [Nitrospiraceae bacterium]